MSCCPTTVNIKILKFFNKQKIADNCQCSNNDYNAAVRKALSLKEFTFRTFIRTVLDLLRPDHQFTLVGLPNTLFSFFSGNVTGRKYFS